MVHDHEGFSVAWWQLALAANAIISIAYLAISALILVPTARAHQLRSNPLAVATGLIFLSCSVGHGLHGLQPLMTDDPSAMTHMNIWWLAAWHTLTAGVAVYYLSLRRYYGGLLTSPLFHDQAAQERLVDLERLAAANAARAEAEADRDSHSAMFQQVIQNSQSLIYVKNLDGEYVMTNSSFDRALGLEAGAMLGLTDADIDPSRAQSWREQDEKARVGLIEVEESNELPDGPHVYETAKFPLRHPDGSLYAVCGVSLDVTEKRMAAAQAVERDIALASNLAKSSFLATMSHEIRTPLNAVIGMTDLLLGSELDEQQRECVDTVRNSGDALLALINDVLDFSKIESGDLELESIALDLGEEAEVSLELVMPGATHKGLELVCDVTRAGSVQLLGDVHRLRQIFANLLSNAVKFTERGEILFTVTAEQLSDTQVHVLASVADTGRGVPLESQDRLFRSYSQMDASTARVHGGTGLGLVISRKLAEAMGGTLTLESTSPSGSTFLLDVVLDVAPTSEQLSRQQLAVVPQLSGKTALLVDDNQTNLRILDYQMSILGLDCRSFSDSAAALQAVADGLTYDVGVLDMHMPQLDGVALGAGLRALPRVSDAPLVLLTSLGGRPAGLERYFSAFLTKPAKRATLHETLLRVLQGRVAAEDERPEVPAVPRRSLRILLAEDNLVNQRVAKLMLGMLGHHVDAVGNGFDAVAAATAGRYDIVLMDVQMPDVDGLEATRRIRSRLPSDQAPFIVAMTANARPQDRDACLAAGMDEYLSKPVRMKELEAVIARTSWTASVLLGDRPTGGGDVTVLDALLEQLGDTGEETRAEIVDQYLAEGRDQLALVQAALAEGDFPSVAAACHTWRSTSDLLGMKELAEVLRQLEADAQAARPDCAGLALELDEEYQRVLQRLARVKSD
jgi:PAS domain S-box-containing protein